MHFFAIESSKEVQFFHHRRGQWAAIPEEYPMKEYPTYMHGILYVLSMSTVRQLAIHCPYHCIAQDHLNYDKNAKQPCFWKFEDVFIGSCVKFIRSNTVFVQRESFRHVSWTNITNKKQMKFLNGQKGLVLNDVKRPQDFLAIQERFDFMKYHHGD